MASPRTCESDNLSQPSSSRAFRVCLAAPPAVSNAWDSSSAEAFVAESGGDGPFPADLASVAQRANDEAVAAARRTLEDALRAKDSEIAAAKSALTAERARSAALAEREECLRNRLVVSEETRALYQLSLHRLLDLIRSGAEADRGAALATRDSAARLPGIAEHVAQALPPGAAPMVPPREIAAAAGAALRSAEAATDDDASSAALRGFTPDGKRRAAGETAGEDNPRAEPPAALSNAALLAASMLSASVADCVAAWGRAEGRREAAGREALAALSSAAMDAMDTRMAALCAAVSAAASRVDEVQITARDAIARAARQRQLRKDAARAKAQAKAEAKAEAKALAEAEAQAKAARVRAECEEERRAVARAGAARIVQHAAEALEDTRQCARAAARDMERCAHEGHSLNEPFLQSVRAIAMRAEAQAQLARATVVRGAAGRFEEERNYAFEKMQRRILSPPRRHSASTSAYVPQETLSAGATTGCYRSETEDSRLLIALEELGRVVANLARLLDNNARQMDENTARVIRTIGAWESTIATRMGNIEAMMAEALAAAGIEEPQRALQVQLQSQVQAIADTVPFPPETSQKQTHTQSSALHAPANITRISTTGGVIEAAQPALVSHAQKFLHTRRTSNATTDSSAPALSGVGSCVSSVAMSRGPSSAPPPLMPETATYPIAQYPPQQGLNSRQPPAPTVRRVQSFPGRSSPLSIAVSPAQTPGQPALDGSVSASQGLSPVSAIATKPRMQYTKRKESEEVNEWLPGSRAIVPRRLNF